MINVFERVNHLLIGELDNNLRLEGKLIPKWFLKSYEMIFFVSVML